MKSTDQKEGRATVKVYYKVGKTLADGSHPFQIRISKNRKQAFKSTGLSLHPKYWNAEKSNWREAIRRSYPDPQRSRLIAKLAELEKKYVDVAEALADSDEQHEADTVFRTVADTRKTMRRVKVLAFIEEIASGAVTIGNAGVYRDLRNQLAKFIGAEANAPDLPLGRGKEAERSAWVGKWDIPFERLTVSFLNEWEATLRATGVGETTLYLRFKTLRAVFNQAIGEGIAKEGWYPFSRNPSDRHKFKVDKFSRTTRKRAITQTALDALRAVEPATDRLRLAKDVFFLSYLAGGINFVDLAQLRWRDLKRGEGEVVRLTYERQKTGTALSFALLPAAVAILDKYRPFTHSGPDAYLLPILHPERHRTAVQIKNRLHKVLGQVNTDLKALAAAAGIDSSLTTYWARHTAASAMKRGGKSVAAIGAVLGHSSEATTQIYLDSLANDVVDDAFNAL